MKGEEVDDTDLFAAFEGGEKDKNGEIPGSNVENQKDSVGDELDLLRNENTQLKKILRRVTCRCTTNEKPIASIMYFDSDNSVSIDQIMKEFLKNNANNGKSHSEIITDSHSSFRDDIAEALGQSMQSVADNNYTELGTNLPLGNVQYFSTYCLDSFGTAVVNLRDPPRFEKVYLKSLPAKDEGGNLRRRQWNSCFNCDGDHKLPECMKPRDLARISAKRKEFHANSSFILESRYHDKEKERKFKHFKPGKITKELREALHLSDHELPPYIYRMRSLGYPPGWFSTNYDSGIVIHGKEGKTDKSVPSAETNEEKGERIRFPGFNCKPPQGTMDLADVFTLPRINKYCLLPAEEDVKTVDRKHRLSSDGGEETSKRRRTLDMDIDNNEQTSESIDAPYSPELPQDISCFTSTPVRMESEVEDGEIPDSPGKQSSDQQDISPSWWFKEPLVSDVVKPDCELVPPPFPLRPLPLHKISQILPGDTNHISFEDRSLWLDPVFGNLQIRTGRFDRLKTILASREKSK